MVPDSFSRIYSVQKIALVVGQPLDGTFPSVYFEDGKLDFENLEGLNPDSAVLVFNNRDKPDLAMSFMQKYFIAGKSALKKEWAVYSKDQYLKYKYELLIRGIKFNDFDFGSGISFSTQKGEKMEFEFKVPESGKYIFVTRLMIPENGDTTFKWKTTEMDLDKGVHNEVIENNYNMQILNVVGLIPKNEFDDAQEIAETFITRFKTVEVAQLDSLNNKYQDISVENPAALVYKFNASKDRYWIILSDNYNPMWQIKRGDEYFPSIPVYSMINGFYIDSKQSDYKIEFLGQKNFRLGAYFSLTSLFVLIAACLFFNNSSSSGKKNSRK